MPGSRRVRARPLTAFLSGHEEAQAKAVEPQAKPEVEVGAKAQVEAEARARTTRQPDCSELIKDRGLLARAITKYLIKYPSVGSLRLAIDLLPCVNDPVEAFLRYVKPVLLLLEKMGFVELVRGDPVVGVMVVNLSLPSGAEQARGDGDGSE